MVGLRPQRRVGVHPAVALLHPGGDGAELGLHRSVRLGRYAAGRRGQCGDQSARSRYMPLTANSVEWISRRGRPSVVTASRSRHSAAVAASRRRSAWAGLIRSTPTRIAPRSGTPSLPRSSSPSTASARADSRPAECGPRRQVRRSGRPVSPPSVGGCCPWPTTPPALPADSTERAVSAPPERRPEPGAPAPTTPANPSQAPPLR